MMKKSKKHHVTSWTMVTLLLTSGALSSGALAVSAVPTPVSATATAAEGDFVEKSPDAQYLSLYPGKAFGREDVQTDLSTDESTLLKDDTILKALNDAMAFPKRLEVVKEWTGPKPFLEIQFSDQHYYINTTYPNIVTISSIKKKYSSEYIFLALPQSSQPSKVYDGITSGEPGTSLNVGDQLLFDESLDSFMHISTISPVGSDKYMSEAGFGPFFGSFAYVNKGQRALQIKADQSIYENPQYGDEAGIVGKTQAQISQAYLIVMDPTTKTEEIGYGYKDEATGRYVFIDLDAAEEIDPPVTPDPDPEPTPDPEPEPEVPETPEMPGHGDWVSPDVAPRYQSRKGNGQLHVSEKIKAYTDRATTIEALQTYAPGKLNYDRVIIDLETNQRIAYGIKQADGSYLFVKASDVTVKDGLTLEALDTIMYALKPVAIYQDAATQQATGQQLDRNVQEWRVLKATRNAQGQIVAYQLGRDQWVRAADLKVEAPLTGVFNTTAGTSLYTAIGTKAGTIATTDAYRVFGVRYIQNKQYIRLGNQSQWVQANDGAFYP